MKKKIISNKNKKNNKNTSLRYKKRKRNDACIENKRKINIGSIKNIKNDKINKNNKDKKPIYSIDKPVFVVEKNPFDFREKYERKDLKRKKIKANFFNQYLINTLNQRIKKIIDKEIVTKNNSRKQVCYKFNKFPRELMEEIENYEFKNILDKKLIDVIDFEELHNIKKSIQKSENNHNLFEELLAKDNKEEALYQKTLKELYNDYLDSEVFKKYKNKLLKNKNKKYDNEYINSLDNIAKNFNINYLSKFKKKRKSRKKKSDI